jgi:NADH-quinone oxidoreductase subunit K
MSLSFFLFTNLILFIIGAIGTFLNRRNFLIMLLCIELMLLSVNLIFLTGATTLDDSSGQLMALWVMTAAAAETALGLALCVLHFRLRNTLDVEFMNLLKGSIFCVYGEIGRRDCFRCS